MRTPTLHLSRPRRRETRLLRALDALNPPGMADLTGDRLIFSRYCAGRGLAVPELLGVIDRRAPGWAPPDRILADARDLTEFVEGLPESFVVTPSSGPRPVEPDTLTRRTAGEFLERLRGTPGADCFLIEEALSHPGVLVRVCTLVPRSGPPEILEAVPSPLPDGVRALVERASIAFLPLRALAWDVAVTSRGPVLLDAHRRWLPTRAPDLRRILTRVGTA